MFVRSLIVLSSAALVSAGTLATGTHAAATPHAGAIIDAALAAHSGLIKSVAEDKNSFVLTTPDDKEMTFKVDAATKYMLDGKEVTRDQALKTGAQASITADKGGLASKVEISTE